MMRDNLDVMGAVILDHITTISAGEGLMKEEVEACIKHLALIEWREVAIKGEFQALTLAEGCEEIWAYEAQSQKSL